MAPSSQQKKFVGLTLSEDVFHEIDRKRGLIPRSTYIDHLLRGALGLEVPA